MVEVIVRDVTDDEFVGHLCAGRPVSVIYRYERY